MWPLRVLAAIGVVLIAVAPRAGAQPPKSSTPPPKSSTPPPKPSTPPPKPSTPPHPQPVTPRPKAPIIVFPQANSAPGITALPINPSFPFSPFSNPALNTPYALNAFNNPYALNAFNNPFALNAFNNPFVPSVFIAQPPFGPNALSNPFANPFGLTAFTSPSVALQQPGQLLWRGPNLQVNPWAGTVYRPQSGVARTADGSVFYHVPGTGVLTLTGTAAPGTGLYYDPRHGTYLNPASGVLSRPATTVFLPWIPG